MNGGNRGKIWWVFKFSQLHTDNQGFQNKNFHFKIKQYLDFCTVCVSTHPARIIREQFRMCLTQRHRAGLPVILKQEVNTECAWWCIGKSEHGINSVVYIINNANSILQPKVWSSIVIISIIFTSLLGGHLLSTARKLCELGALTKEIILYLRVHLY